MSNMFINIKDSLNNRAIRQIIAASLFDPSSTGQDEWAARLRDHANEQVYGWVENGVIVGVCSFNPQADKTEITNIAVAENARRCGIGSAMVTALQELFPLPVEAETDDDAVEFYRKCGFETVAFDKQYGSGTICRYTCVLPVPEKD